jgi:hypothetical protein
MKISDRSYENVARFRSLGMLIYQNLIHEGMKSRINSIMLATIQFRASCLLSKNMKTTNTKP